MDAGQDRDGVASQAVTDNPRPDQPMPWWGYLLGLLGMIAFMVVLALTVGRYFTG